MLDLAQGLISWKAESKEESLCGTYRLQFSLESWRRPGHWSSSWDDSSGLQWVFSGFNFNNTWSAKGIPGPHILLSALLGL